MKRGSTKKGLQQHLVVFDGQGFPQCLLVRSASAQNAQEVGNAYCLETAYPIFTQGFQRLGGIPSHTLSAQLLWLLLTALHYLLKSM